MVHRLEHLHLNLLQQHRPFQSITPLSLIATLSIYKALTWNCSMSTLCLAWIDLRSMILHACSLPERRFLQRYTTDVPPCPTHTHRRSSASWYPCSAYPPVQNRTNLRQHVVLALERAFAVRRTLHRDRLPQTREYPVCAYSSRVELSTLERELAVRAGITGVSLTRPLSRRLPGSQRCSSLSPAPQHQA